MEGSQNLGAEKCLSVGFRLTNIKPESRIPLSLHQGVSLTAQRAAIVVGVELPVYDITKKHLILSGYMGDTVYTHFV